MNAISTIQPDLFGTQLSSIERCENYSSRTKRIKHDLNKSIRSMSLVEHFSHRDWNSFPVNFAEASYPLIQTIHIVISDSTTYFDIERTLEEGGCLKFRLEDKAYLTFTTVLGKEYILFAFILEDFKFMLLNLSENVVLRPYTFRSALTSAFVKYNFTDVFPNWDTGSNVVYIKAWDIAESTFGKKVNMKLADKFATRLKDAAASEYSIKLVQNKFDDSTLLLEFSYSFILGGRVICVIDAETVPDEFKERFITKVNEPVRKPVNPIMSQMDATKITIEDELKQLIIVSDSRIEMPKKELIHYQKIRRLMIEANGKYRKAGFDFKTRSATSIISDLLKGIKVRSLHKDFAFFPTSNDESERLVSRLNLFDGSRVFEPHAGQGHVADAVRRVDIEPIVNEIWEENVSVLKQKGYQPYEKDFLLMSPADIGGKVDAVVGNPPWGSLVDIDHFMHCLTFLKSGGGISMIVSESAFTSSTVKAATFRELLQSQNAQVFKVEAGEFEGTNVSGRAILIENYTY
ncbi:hypothetical protein [Enterovibrio norvegicus]|uniref:hypothetical protein n=1 Tax=Enterovibrio norvegicus TaxID=188144 RepID=UPI000C84CAA0|nr:hypothetical protein [Enterovibrio norvegicus]PMH64530.1 hypothetical protein BCU62_15865 [Enterovibrio norvegicus]